MDETILHNFFSSVHSNDVVYFLGDLTFRKEVAEQFFSEIRNRNIQFHHIFGNHDHGIKKIIERNATSFADIKFVSPNGQPIVLCHYAMRVWHKSHYGSWQLYGHSHGTLPPVGKQWDVGVDKNNFTPISFSTVKNIMESRPDNENLIKQRREE
jgi:calcineurin-like phosphoesterase family protein